VRPVGDIPDRRYGRYHEAEDDRDEVRARMRGRFTRAERKVLRQWSLLSQRASIRESSATLGVQYDYLRRLIRRLHECA
jgi:hypothetical protein